ncbi:MAG: HlyD family efflux transporter periplasmic adaptor subunit [Succinivibrionaceae bacterium]
MKKVVMILVILAVIGGICTRIFWPQDRTISKLYGNVDIHQVNLSFEVSGRVATIEADEGQMVKKGDVLARLEDTSLQLRRSVAETELEKARENLHLLLNGNREEEINMAYQQSEQSRAKLTLAEINYQRNSSLYEKSHGQAISKALVDEAKSNLQEAKAALAYAREHYKLLKKGPREEDINLARIAVKTAQLNLDLLDDEISKMILVAPQDGVIRNRIIEVGDLSSSSKTAFKILLVQDKEIRAYVDLGNLPRIKYGQQVKISATGVDGELSGTISYISQSAEFTPKNVETEELRSSLVYEVKIQVKDPENVLHLGVPVTVSL